VPHFGAFSAGELYGGWCVKKPSVLIVDDEPSIRSVILELLLDAGHQAADAESAEAALALLAQQRYDIVFTDIRMPGMDGIALLRQIKEKDPAIEVIVLTSHSSFSSAVEALRLGAYDYLIKPLNDLEEVLTIIQRVAEKLALAEENTRLVGELQTKNDEVEESRNQLAQYSEDLSALYAAEKEIMAGLDLAEVYGRSAGALSKLMGGHPALVWMVSEGDLLLLPKAQSCLKTFDKVQWSFPLFDPLREPHFEVPAAWQDACRARFSALSALFHPVVSHQKFIALLGTLAFEPNAFSQRDADMLARFSSSAAMAMENARLYAEAKALSIRDGLTGLYNRRHFEEVMTVEGARSIRHQQPVSLLFLDVDHFKHYNDTQGHLMGDGLLKQLAGVILKRVRITDIVCRYGGEEITLILPHTNKANARIVAEDIRKRIEAYPFTHRESQPLGAVTVSIGIAECPADSKVPVEMIRLADTALYEAKQAGRNRVCVCTPPSENP